MRRRARLVPSRSRSIRRCRWSVLVKPAQHSRRADGVGLPANFRLPKPARRTIDRDDARHCQDLRPLDRRERSTRRSPAGRAMSASCSSRPPRAISPSIGAAHLPRACRQHVGKVGVFVDPDDALLDAGDRAPPGSTRSSSTTPAPERAAAIRARTGLAVWAAVAVKTARRSRRGSQLSRAPPTASSTTPRRPTRPRCPAAWACASTGRCSRAFAIRCPGRCPAGSIRTMSPKRSRITGARAGRCLLGRRIRAGRQGCGQDRRVPSTVASL